MTTTGSVRFEIVDLADGQRAYDWHRGFAGAYEFILPRPWKDDFEHLAAEGQVLAARDQRGDFLGLAYLRLEKDAWEIGGLMVDRNHGRRGIGEVLARFAVAHVLATYDPLDRGFHRARPRRQSAADQAAC